MAAAELSVGLRMATATRSDVRQALWVDRSLIKTFGPRGTVHLLPAHELPMWTSSLSSVPAGPDGLPPGLRLSDTQTAEIIAAMDAAVRDAELTLDELGERVVAATGPWADERVIPAFNEMWPRWRRAIIPAARQGVLCFGPDRGRNVTYTSPRRWLPGFHPPTRRPPSRTWSGATCPGMDPPPRRSSRSGWRRRSDGRSTCSSALARR